MDSRRGFSPLLILTNLERRHYQRIRSKAIEEASADLPSPTNWQRPVSIAGSVLLVGLFGWFFVSRVLPDPDREEGADPTVAGVGETVGDESPGLEVKEVQQLVDDFLSASSVEELLTMVEEPEVSEAQIRRFLEESGSELPFEGNIGGFIDVEYDGDFRYDVMIDGLLGRTSKLSIGAGKDGTPLVHWGWSIGWMDPDWETVIAAKLEETVGVKVFLVLDDYYNYDYRDEAKWQSVRLSDSLMKIEPIYGFIERSNPDLKKAMRCRQFEPVTAEIKFLPGQTHDLVEVVSLKHFSWVGD
ncbi:MAG: hypothetical protein ACI9UA_005119 [Pseudoalteromonas tetraodonis]|jgi:hypothetical protein